MIWGVEGRHLWVPPALVALLTVPDDLPDVDLAFSSSGEVPLGLNYRTDDYGDEVWPRYHVKKIGGLMGTGDSSDARNVRVGVEGEIPRRSFRRGKTIAYEGITEAQTRSQLRKAEAELTAAFSDQTAEGLMVVTPHPLYALAESGRPDSWDSGWDSGEALPYRYFYAKALMVEISDEITVGPGRPSRGHESPFVVSIRNARAGGVSYRDESAGTYP